MNRSIIILLLTLCVSSLFATPSIKNKVAPGPPKKLNIITSLSVLAELTRELGGDFVNVESLSSADQDPHFVKALPSFKRLLGNADLLIQIGRSLELWVPQVIASSGNAKLISGSGLITASEGISPLEVPKALTREQGDIHPQGNPHVWLSPSATLKMAANIRDALIKIDAEHKAIYEKNFASFKEKLAKKLFGEALVKAANNNDFLWRLHEGHKLLDYVKTRKLALGGWIKEAEAINYPFFTYHSVFSYLAHEFSLKIVGQIEEKSGVAPTLKYLSELKKKAKEQKITHIVAANYYVGHKGLITTLAKDIGGHSLFIAVDCKPKQSYFEFIDQLLRELVNFKTPVKPAA
ncbi:MAG TPA: metal ABC transporter substrate-binding protein [Myxococcota bacterium]|nr:metal ABC transporter substrate-binding protein [Myxococcota bacterium]